MTDTTTTTKTRTITMTDRPPVRIREDEWPTIAVGSDAWHDGEIRAQANRTRTAWIRVRQHADGRAVVYGYYDYSSHFQGERDETVRAGYLIAPGKDLAATIRRVEATLVGDGADEAMTARVAAECIADLPAEDL